MVKRLLELVIILCLFSVNASATSETGTLKFGMLDLKPIGCDQIDGEPSCLQSKLIKELATATSLSFESILVSYPRMLKLLTNGNLDLVFSIHEKHLAELVEPIAKALDIRFVLITKNSALLTQNLPHKRVALLRGAKHPHFDKYLGSYVETSVKDLNRAMQMLLASRIDALAGPEFILDYLLRKNEVNQASIYKPVPPFQSEVYLFCRKGVCGDVLTQTLAAGIKAIQPEKIKLMEN